MLAGAADDDLVLLRHDLPNITTTSLQALAIQPFAQAEQFPKRIYSSPPRLLSGSSALSRILKYCTAQEISNPLPKEADRLIFREKIGTLAPLSIIPVGTASEAEAEISSGAKRGRKGMRAKGLWLALFLCGAVAVQGHTQSLQQLLAEGDSARAHFELERALRAYQEAVKIDSNHCEALWKLAQAYVDVGEKKPEKEQGDYYRSAERYARKAVQLCPGNAEAHFVLSMAVGRVALLVGGKRKVELSREVKEEAEKAIQLNPNHDGALHVLARWHREVANLSGILKLAAKVVYGGLPAASNEEAVAYFKRAIEIKPEHIHHHLELGRTYEMMKQYDLARAEYRKVLELPVSDPDDPDYKAEARQLLQGLQGK
jgi:tetratricopeptide (TPR) repeat protein